MSPSTSGQLSDTIDDGFNLVGVISNRTVPKFNGVGPPLNGEHWGCVAVVVSKMLGEAVGIDC